MEKPRRENGVIINALKLEADDVIGKKVACPLCGVYPPFRKWSFGWDAHAESKCEAVSHIRGRKKRKAQYKQRTSHLFR